MHLYDDHRSDAQRFVDEGYQARIEMPPMPTGDPWPAIGVVLDAERRIRAGDLFDANLPGLNPYWSDLIRLLQIFFSDDEVYIETLGGNMFFQRYRPYIMSRIPAWCDRTSARREVTHRRNP